MLPHHPFELPPPITPKRKKISCAMRQVRGVDKILPSQSLLELPSVQQVPGHLNASKKKASLNWSVYEKVWSCGWMVKKMGVAAFGIRDDDDDDDDDHDDEGVSPNITNNNNQICHILEPNLRNVFFFGISRNDSSARSKAHTALQRSKLRHLRTNLTNLRCPVAGGKLSVGW